MWEYFSGKAEQRGVDLSELPTEVLKRDIEINEALKQASLKHPCSFAAKP